MRYFEFVKNEELAKFENCDYKIPMRATKYSAGYDFISPLKFTLNPSEVRIVPTGIKAKMQNDEVLKIYIRSSLAVKYGIKLVNMTAIIDSDYFSNEDNDGHIFIGLENTSDKQYTVNVGDKIAQGIFEKYLTVDNDNVETKRVGGIGSTSR